MLSKEINTRVGIGYDVHKLVSGRKLIIGAVLIDSELGALGFSDADVLIHAIADALLGAAALGDIGHHFPDTDSKNEGLSGSYLLSEVVRLLNSNNFSIVNIDSTVILQSPKISSHIYKMRENLSLLLDIDISRVSVKATTTERLGFIGKNEGIAAEAIVLLRENI
jgi:2-C-methyl-D-erythritol 2,4-cyclodiphosphate synthase